MRKTGNYSPNYGKGMTADVVRAGKSGEILMSLCKNPGMWNGAFCVGDDRYISICHQTSRGRYETRNIPRAAGGTFMSFSSGDIIVQSPIQNVRTLLHQNVTSDKEANAAYTGDVTTESPEYILQKASSN